MLEFLIPHNQSEWFFVALIFEGTLKRYCQLLKKLAICFSKYIHFVINKS